MTLQLGRTRTERHAVLLHVFVCAQMLSLLIACESGSKLATHCDWLLLVES